MKKRYTFTFMPIIIVIAVAINILLLTVIVLNSLKVGGIGVFETVNKGLDIGAIVLSIILIIVVDIFMFASSYTLHDKYLSYNLGFVRYKIYYRDMVVIREEKNSRTLVVSYKKIGKEKDGSEACFVNGIVINIANSRKDKFIEDLRAKNSNLEYQLLDKELEE